jgi:1-acyl-sn-glycerol-3-phosphate acyltransferase
MQILAYPAVGAFLAGGYLGWGLYRLSGLWRGRAPSRAAQVAQWWCRRMWPLLRLRVRVHGTVPSLPCVCIANHRSYLDIVVLTGVVGGAFLSRSDVLGWPMVGTVASEMGSVFVERDDAGDRTRAARAVLRAARNRRVLVFPEGTTFGDPLPRAFESGLFRLLQRSAAAIVPVTVRYSDRRAYWVEDLSMWQHLQQRVFDGPPFDVDVHVGASIDTSAFSDAEALRDAVYDAVCEPLRTAGELCTNGPR